MKKSIFSVTESLFAVSLCLTGTATERDNIVPKMLSLELDLCKNVNLTLKGSVYLNLK